MASNRLNVERFGIKIASRNDVSISWHPSGKLASVSEVRSEAPLKRVGCPIPHANSGKWLDEGTVPHRAGVPDPNVLSVRNISRIGENIGDYPGDTCNEGKADLLTLHGSVDALPAFGAIESTPHSAGLIRQQVTR